MKWDGMPERGEWICEIGEGQPYFFISVCYDGTFDVDLAPGIISHKVPTFDTLALAKKFCEERYANYLKEQEGQCQGS